jgi:hypothetical protein
MRNLSGTTGRLLPAGRTTARVNATGRARARSRRPSRAAPTGDRCRRRRGSGAGNAHRLSDAGTRTLSPSTTRVTSGRWATAAASPAKVSNPTPAPKRQRTTARRALREGVHLGRPPPMAGRALRSAILAKKGRHLRRVGLVDGQGEPFDHRARLGQWPRARRPAPPIDPEFPEAASRPRRARTPASPPLPVRGAPGERRSRALLHTRPAYAVTPGW